MIFKCRGIMPSFQVSWIYFSFLQQGPDKSFLWPPVFLHALYMSISPMTFVLYGINYQCFYMLSYSLYEVIITLPEIHFHTLKFVFCFIIYCYNSFLDPYFRLFMNIFVPQCRVQCVVALFP